MNRACCILLAGGLLLGANEARSSDIFIEGLALYDAGNVEPIYDLWQGCAEEGNVDCISGLANLHHLGVGIDIDLPEAIRYYRMAVLHGDGNALINLMELLCQSDNRIADLEAQAWLHWNTQAQILKTEVLQPFARQCENR